MGEGEGVGVVGGWRVEGEVEGWRVWLEDEVGGWRVEGENRS